MHILSAQLMPGANIYSLHPVLKIRLDLGDYAEIGSDRLPEFSEQLVAALPGLLEHCCSKGYPGGFVDRLKEGTYLAHIFEHVVIELQCMVGHQVSFGKARNAGQQRIYNVIVGCRAPRVAIEAAYAAEDLLTRLLNGVAVDMTAVKQRLKAAIEADALGPSTASIYEAARKRNIPVTRQDGEDLLILGYGYKQQRVWATLTGKTSALAVDLAGDKELTKQVLAQGGVPVPEGLVVESVEGAVKALKLFHCPVAIKPLNGNQGKGVTLNVTTPAEAERAFQIAAQYDRRIVIEEYITGRQYRLCIVNGKMTAAAERIPAYVLGDGKHSIKDLVDVVNSDPLRGEGHEKPLTKINIDTVALTVLAKQGMTQSSIPEVGQVVYIRDNANLSTGGTAVDVTDAVHPEVVLVAERAARITGLDVAGVDIVAADIAKPLRDTGGAVIEVNAAPGIRMHHYPAAGKPRDVAGQIVDYLFPDGEDGRIPTLAVTGTNGKTTVSRMIGHIWQAADYKVGMTTTDGIYINGKRIVAGDTTGPTSARTVLTDPAVEVAVLETARGGIMRGGLGFESCDVAVITNISEDHFGQDGIENIADLVYVKALLAEVVRPGGYVILNADDPNVSDLAARAKGEVVLFSLEADNLLIRRHLSIGGKAFFVKDNAIYAACGSLGRTIVRVSDVPVTLGGVALHNVQNAVIAAAACYCMKVPLSYIRRGLSTFDQNPGRLNMINIGDFRVCIDYGHNPAGYHALTSTAKRLGASRLVGVIGAPGDRREDVIINVGRIAGKGFDYIYIKEDNDLRGRSEGETAGLLLQGVLEAGLPKTATSIILEEGSAVRVALEAAKPNDLIVIFYEKYDNVMEVISSFRADFEERATERSDALPPAAVEASAL